jgi:hypothetical protein
MVLADNQDICQQLRVIILRSKHQGREEQWLIFSQYGRTEGSGLQVRGQGLGDYREFGKTSLRIDNLLVEMILEAKHGGKCTDYIINHRVPV